MAAPPKDFWLVQVGEELPGDAGSPRLLRTALLADELTRRGHRVTYWNATFNHTQKQQRTGGEARFSAAGGYRVKLLNGRAYDRNISIARIFSHQDNARDFAARAPAETRPDAILCGYPTIELADTVSAYAARRRVPLAIDCRDMWPDVIENQVPAIVRALAASVFIGWRRARRRALARATAVTGITDAFVDWGVAAAGRARAANDRAFHLAVPPGQHDPAALVAAAAVWEARLGPPDPAVKVLAFGGTLSRRIDLATLVDGALALPPAVAARIQLVLCGAGDLQDELAHRIGSAPHVVLAGWRSPIELRALMDRAVLGVLPYPNTEDFLASFPNKVGEYLSAGLPVLTGLQGVTGGLLAARGLLEAYTAEDRASVTAALTRISDGPSETGRSEQAHAAFRELFDPNVIYPAFADYMESLAGTPECPDERLAS